MLARAGAAIAVAALLPAIVHAQPTAHYVPGIEGVKGASLPPPGVYLRDYNVAYYATQVNDASGHAISGADPKAFVYANVPRILWITDVKVLGGFLGVDALLPLQYTDIQINTPIGRYSDNNFGIGDAFAEVTLSWHTKRFDFAIGDGMWAPTGDSPPPAVHPGKGYWGNMITAGATWYCDEKKKWAISALNRYEINLENNDTDITTGQTYTVEGGISRALSPTVDLGAIGYYQQKVTTDSGPGSNDVRDRVAGIGPEISVFYPRITFGWSLRYAYEFMAESRLQGHTLAFTLTKRF